MAVTAKLFGNALKQAMNGEWDWDSDTIKVMLCTSSYAPDQDVHDYKDDVDNEVSGTGYTAGGVALASCSVAYTAGTNVIKVDADDATWAASTITARYAVIYKSTGVDSTSPVIAYIDFGEDKSSENGAFTIEWHADGIATITVS